MEKIKDNTTFIVDIKDNQHATWQGTVEWVQERRTENFRSMLELFKLIDSAMEESKTK